MISLTLELMEKNSHVKSSESISMLIKYNLNQPKKVRLSLVVYAGFSVKPNNCLSGFILGKMSPNHSWLTMLFNRIFSSVFIVTTGFKSTNRYFC